MRIRSLVILLLASLAFAAIVRFGAGIYLASLEDYQAEQGSLTYYLGISSLIRSAPVLTPAAPPVYSGSVGDGAKPPQSSVVYDTAEKSPAMLADAVARFLQQRGFSLDRPRPPETPLYPDEKTILRQDDYRSASGQAVSLTVAKTTATQLLQVQITHFE